MSNWRLPTKDELNTMYVQMHKKRIGGFASGFYWSSLEGSSKYAWFQYFGDGYQTDYYKYFYRRVRLVRDLPEDNSGNYLVLFLADKHFEVAWEDEGKMTWDEAMKIYGAAEKGDLEIMTAERDAWMSKARRYLHLLALVEDDIRDGHTLGSVRAALEEDKG
jgi:hypothetical protein